MHDQEKNDHQVILEYDFNCYSIEAITCSAYDLMSRASIQFKKIDNKVIVYIRNKDQSKNNLEKIAFDFNDCVLDHQVQFLVNKEFRLIREIIVAQAFQPCDDIKDIVNVLKNE